MEDTFSGSREDLENADEQLYSSPPRPQPLPFETLSLKILKLSLPHKAQLFKIELKTN